MQEESLKETNKNELTAYLKRDRIYIPTGIRNLDGLLDGYYPSTVWVIGGWPGTGKTTLTLNLVSKLEGKKISVFTTGETSKERFMEKLLCALTNTSDKDIRTGNQRAIDTLSKNIHLLDKYDLNVIDKSSPSLKDIEDELKLREPDIMFIDYFQNLEIPENVTNRYAAFTNVARALEKVIKKHTTTLVLNSQLRKPEDINMRPTLFDFKETGKLGEMAYCGILVSANQAERSDGEMYVEVAKARDGKLGSFTIKGNWECNKLV